MVIVIILWRGGGGNISKILITYIIQSSYTNTIIFLPLEYSNNFKLMFSYCHLELYHGNLFWWILLMKSEFLVKHTEYINYLSCMLLTFTSLLLKEVQSVYLSLTQPFYWLILIDNFWQSIDSTMFEIRL